MPSTEPETNPLYGWLLEKVVDYVRDWQATNGSAVQTRERTRAWIFEHVTEDQVKAILDQHIEANPAGVVDYLRGRTDAAEWFAPPMSSIVGLIEHRLSSEAKRGDR